MNERIRELAEQATSYNNSDGWLFDKEKFAELIVRECCRALNPMLPPGLGVDMIKLHFGMNPKEITTAMLDASIAQCERELAKKKSGVEE